MREVAEAEMATARESEAKADVMVVVTAVALRVDNAAVTLFWVEQYWRTRCRYKR
jgi:hypothetical protein